MTIGSIDSSFISRLTGIAPSKGSKLNLQNSTQNNSQQNAAKLQGTANTLGNAYVRLNSVESALRLSQETLTQLGELTDRALSLTERSARSSTSAAQRRSLNTEFQKIGREFKKVAESIKQDDVDLLSVDDLAGVFGLLGLDTKKSRALAEIFSGFVTSKSDDTLASESIKGKPVLLPSAIQPPEPTEAFSREKVSSNTSGTNPTTIGISTTATVFVDDQDPTNQNEGGVDNAIIVSDLGHSQSVNNVDSNVTLLATSEFSGYSLVVSDQDFLGTNGAEVNQLFLINENGEVIHQYTDFSTSVSIESGDLSSNGAEIAFVSNGDLVGSNADGSEEVFRISVQGGDLGDFGANEISQITKFNANGNILDPVKITESGSRIAFGGNAFFSDTGEQFRGVLIYDIETESYDVNHQLSVFRVKGFQNDGTLIVQTTNRDIYSLTFDVPGSTLIHEPLTNAPLLTVSETGYLAYRNTSNDIIALNYADGYSNDTILVYDSADGDSFSSLAITLDQSGNLKVAASGTIAAQDSLNQVYVFKENLQNTAAVIAKPDNFEKIFDFSISNRSNAFRVREDLNALKDQIADNLKGVENALKVLRDNMQLVEAMGSSFITLAANPVGLTDSDTIASKLSRAIRSYGISSDSLNQLENITPILSATLAA